MPTPARRTIAVCNFKGGSAKSTTTVNVAAGLAERGARVLVVDLDAQGTLSAWIGEPDPADSLLGVYTRGADLGELARPSRVPGVDVVASSPALTERALAAEPLAVAAMRRAVEALDGPWSAVLFDTPPAIGNISVSALVAAPEALITVEASYAALAGLPAVLDTLASVRDRLPPGPRLLGVVACRVDMRMLATRGVVEALRDRLGSAVFDTTITETVRLREAVGARRSIFDHDPTSTGATDYRALVTEILDRG